MTKTDKAPIKSEQASVPRRARNKGRPAPESGIGAEGIVDATIELLRTRAPESLTVIQIAEHAGVDPALVRYYFGGKDGLYTAVVSRLMAERQEIHRTLMNRQGTTQERLKRRIKTAIEQQEKHPSFHRLVVERMFEADTPQAREALEMTAARGLALTVDLLHGSGDNSLRNVDPRFLNVAMIGMCEFFVSARPLVEALCGRPVDEELVGNYVTFVVDLLMNGLSREKTPETETGDSLI
ncbi:TetR/AcrR family transcriptional regulator [Burkholderia multivorans]|uniref:TetR/AcrR family transcriptional regulator n=1 Tax=Burkholderia multivorans TaxID=87883 RepID=UPI00209DD06E|nr:TetR/AcrR family transcriptional regulator [Burkholderia multivorans]MCO8591158.1 TetR/AcrR family transcriptional regulator [Burkholderia multivorans]MCO8612096.1 TetR/AcrR family transcriptional regulator [Burkholderia multivorans]MCO8632892.1 TetR/AcrR family transcriptional regulator [Burkholderia multivorans]MCO8638433.1 TetR/AcrR family transcriptional regulator [Burkholderia multivorans]MCO8646441.1 TetR/AcrR family transcriptional regulator [Burkholderia multivorans]